MKHEEFKTACGEAPQEFHNCVVTTLNSLPEAPQRERKPRRAVKIALVCAVIAALGTATAIAAAGTGMFGLWKEDIGKYGMKVSVKGTPDEPAATKHPKLKLGYVPEGCEPIKGEPYKYDYKDALSGEEWAFGFMLTEAADYEYTEEYVVKSFETVFNGHKVIVAKRQFETAGDVTYNATEYFEDWGYVVVCFCPKEDELLKIMEHLDLEEDVDYVEETLPEDFRYDEKRADYGWEGKNKYRFAAVNEPFGWQERVIDGKHNDDFTIRVTSVEEREGIDGLDRACFTYSDDELSSYFDRSGRLISPYTRTDVDFGDGVNTLDKKWETTDGRHFFIVTVDVTAHIPTDEYGNFDLNSIWAMNIDTESGDENGFARAYGNSVLIYAERGDDCNLVRIPEGETRTLTLGVVVDDDVLDYACLTFDTQETAVSDADKTVYQTDRFTCVPLKQ